MQARRLPPQIFATLAHRRKGRGGSPNRPRAIAVNRRYQIMKTIRLSCALFLGIALSLFAADKPEEKLKPALDVITPDALLAHIKILSSDEFEGRAPGSKGEELSIKYISDQFRSIGLKHGNPDGSYFQEVPLAGIKSALRMVFALAGRPPVALKYPYA